MERRPVAVPGWDSEAVIVDDAYVERVPRRPEVRARLEQECRLLPVIAPLLPLAVPVPHPVAADEHGPWRVRHRIVPGSPAVPEELTAADGNGVGSFIRALHDIAPHELPLPLGPDPDLPTLLRSMAEDVLPMLAADLRDAGMALLAGCATPTPLVLAHGDLGPAHLLVSEGRVSGVIDWSDACLRDPAIDLAWVLHGTPAVFRDAVTAAYQPTVEERDRSLDWHRLGPWHEVLFGLQECDHGYVESGLAGVVQRLRSASGPSSP